jgi:hypothetical protein
MAGWMPQGWAGEHWAGWFAARAWTLYICITYISFFSKA